MKTSQTAPSSFAATCLRASLALAPLMAAVAPAAAHDYPTVDRVVYVQECMRQHPGAHYEMINKCACALDKIASQVPYDSYETMVTATNANTISGERGNAIRDADKMQVEIRRFRQIQADAKKSCFINVQPN